MLKKYRHLLVLLCIMGLLSCIFWQFQLLQSFEDGSYDLLQYLSISNDIDDIVIIGIDDASLQRIGRWPWDREVFARALNNLWAMEPVAVGIDVLWTEASAEARQDQLLAQTLINQKRVVLAGYIGDMGPSGRTSAYIAPLSEFNALSGHINIFTDPDGILRRYPGPMTVDGRLVPSFAQQVLSVSGRMPEQPGLFGTHVPYRNEPGRVPRLSFFELLDNTIDPGAVKNRIVLIGPMAIGLQDHYFTPVGGPMFGVEFHAQVIAALEKQKMLSVYPHGMAVTLFFGLFGAGFFYFVGWLWGLLGLVVIMAGYGLFSLYQMEFTRQFWPIAYPQALLFLAYLFNTGLKIWSAQRAKQETFAVLSRYVSPDVAREAVAQGQGKLLSGGMQKEITVLFMDIRGFTGMAENTPPLELVHLVNDVFTLATACIFKYAGSVNKYIGDAVMAVYNAPLDLPDHSTAAVATAIDLQRCLRREKQRLRGLYQADINIGIAIHTGMAVVGNIGTEQRLEYTAMGDTVNIAARLEHAAREGQILISRNTRDQLTKDIPTHLQGELELKGKTHPVETYLVDWEEDGAL